MNFIKTLFVTGYRPYELSIFSSDDPKLHYIKLFLEKEIKRYVEEGLEWVIIAGNIGTELWVGELVLSLKDDYEELKLGVLLPFAEMASKWNEANQTLYNTVIEQADYVNYTSNKPYTNPSQLKNNQEFIIQNTDACLLFYDPEYPGKASFIFEAAILYQEHYPYDIQTISFDELQWFVNEIEEL
ncbi:DUF1273 domain-containing protein [Alkalibacterium sp. MB6]|uniref:DUF1273 domain-containing protein n=1 Tax=Alkalibacterium sp. MB6 TaxID=2081965 RepID=UPI00137B019C|nr:DUF1273 domain-containing protein [Alkalibacterium sp. MB6]